VYLQRARAQDGYLAGAFEMDELGAKLAALEERVTRETAQRGPETLSSRQREIEGLERDRDALLERYARMVLEGLDRYTPEDRHQAYKELRLKWFVHPLGRMQADGVFNLDVGRCCVRENRHGGRDGYRARS
jgi:hypothetical protein